MALFFSGFLVFVLRFVPVFGAPRSDINLGLDLTHLKPLRWYVNLTSEGGSIRHYHLHHHKGGRIVGGQVATLGAFPYQAALILDYSNLCGGSLISEEYVLTSAHCTVGKSNYVIILGALSLAEKEDTQVYRSASSIHIHPGFNANKYINDISIIKLNCAVTLNNVIKTINLAPRNAGQYSGETAVVTGWGKVNDDTTTSSLHYVSLSVLSNEYCTNLFGTVIQDSHVCSTGENSTNVFGPCSGDSGGPLVHNGVQIGLVSFGVESCVKGYPTVHTRISSFRNWIAEITGV